jgi:hypothetical protein
MDDQHLNLFYSYNRDNELIENNLARAWIVTLRMLSAETRNQLLQILFDELIQKLGHQPPAFKNANFALQGYFDTHLLDTISLRFIVTIASEREFEPGEDSSAWDDTGISSSIPDAWIYDPDQGYCFLIEAKIGTNPLDTDQVYSHASGWLGITKDQLSNHLIPLTWHDVLCTLQSINLDMISQIEAQLIMEFTHFLGFFGYRLFMGFNFSSLLDAPEFSLLHK